jgi:alpha-L-fucosidase 2
MKKIVKTLSVFCLAATIASCGQNEKENRLKLWYTTPAEKWVEALPLGNGRLGAMVFGQPAEERLQLNEETVWAGQPNNNNNPEARKYLPQVRQLMFEGKWREAQDLVDAKMFPRNDMGFNQGMSYQPVGDLHLSFAGHEQPADYYRELDLTSAVATTRYTVDGVEYTREYFTSFPAQVIATRISASQKGKINFAARFTSPQRHSVSVKDNKLTLRGISGDQEGLEGKVQFTAEVCIVPENGQVEAGDTALNIVGADAATIYISIATNFVNYHDLSGKPDEQAEACMSAALKTGYKTLKAEHSAYYRQYFDRVTLDLGTTDSIRKPVDRRILEFSKGNDPQLAALYFQFGRYLLISCSQPGGQPATLQGIWNHHLQAPWDSKYTTNINAEMNYWPAEVANLPEMHEPFIKMVKEVATTGAKTAEVMYGARGWVLHHNTDLWRITAPVDFAAPGMWPSGEAWFSEHLWERYLYSGDKNYLAEVYPVMKGAATFLLDFMVEEPEHHWLVSAPSNSPENAFERVHYTTNTYGVTMDVQLTFELFTNVIAAAETLGIDAAFADSLKQARAKLPPMHIGKHSQLQEWLFDWDDPDDKHRHVSHLYALYPSYQISPFRTPELFDAARNSLNYRGDPATGWSMGWKVCLWARFLDGNRAYKLITEQLKLSDSQLTDFSGGGTYPNMFDAHPPFQIDGNFGCTAGIAEMFMQSHDGAIYVLPAVPDIWSHGRIGGLRARGGFVIENLEWNNGKITALKIKSTIGGNLRLRSVSPLSMANGDKLTAAQGDNPNPLFKTPDIPKPIISPEAKLNPPAVKPVLEYDVPTEAGGYYSFKAMDN